MTGFLVHAGILAVGILVYAFVSTEPGAGLVMALFLCSILWWLS